MRTVAGGSESVPAAFDFGAIPARAAEIRAERGLRGRRHLDPGSTPGPCSFEVGLEGGGRPADLRAMEDPMDPDDRPKLIDEAEPKPGEPPPPPKRGIPPGTPNWWCHSGAPWDRRTIPVLVRRVNGTAWTPTTGGWMRSFRCPRCTHQIVVELIGRGTDKHSEAPREGDLRMPTQATPARGSCQTDKTAHPGRPGEGTTGCGQSAPVSRL